jgi:DNA-binding response OmpR family regulator
MIAERDVICASSSDWRRIQVGRILESAGFRVYGCSTADELLHLAARMGRRAVPAEPAIVLLDTQLSNRRVSSSLVGELHHGRTTLRTIVLAEPADEGEIIRCLEEGADDFIHLPAEPAEIVDVVLRVSALPRIV